MSEETRGGYCKKFPSRCLCAAGIQNNTNPNISHNSVMIKERIPGFKCEDTQPAYLSQKCGLNSFKLWLRNLKKKSIMLGDAYVFISDKDLEGDNGE